MFLNAFECLNTFKYIKRGLCSVPAGGQKSRMVFFLCFKFFAKNQVGAKWRNKLNKKQKKRCALERRKFWSTKLGYDQNMMGKHENAEKTIYSIS